jgi:hypothetical protein
MRFIFILPAFMAVLLAVTACGTRNAPFCLVGRDVVDCGYYSLESCQRSSRGEGGFCRPNSR